MSAALAALLEVEFRERFGRGPTCGARAPGRVNLIGEHTDYNEGLVLPCAIDRDTVVWAAARDDARVRVWSRERGGPEEFDAQAPQRRGGWLDYVQGVVRALAEAGAPPRGADLAVASDVPAESGLSSSAALTLAVATALDACFGLGLDARARAGAAHRAESGFVGMPCGWMDPLTSALGRRGCALRIDCRGLAVTPVPLPGAARLLVAHCGVRRALAAGGYSERRRECERALRAARAAGLAPPDAVVLRDLCPDALPALEERLDPLLARRARHVLTENARVDGVCAAFAAGDLPAAGALLCEGMRSLRDDFEVSIPELDALCEIADALPGVYGSRLTGAGFGGCSVHLVDAAAVEDTAARLAEAFATRFGRRPPLWQVAAAPGAGPLAAPGH